MWGGLRQSKLWSAELDMSVKKLMKVGQID